jgi:hypothetical protein
MYVLRRGHDSLVKKAQTRTKNKPEVVVCTMYYDVLRHRHNSMYIDTDTIVGLHTVPSDGYGHTIDGHKTGMAQPSTVRTVW